MAKTKSPLTEIRKKVISTNLSVAEIDKLMEVLNEKKEQIKAKEIQEVEEKMQALNQRYTELTGTTYMILESKE